MFKLSVKLLVIGLSVVALLSVLIVTMLSWSLSDTVNTGQVKLKQTASLMQAESSLGKLANQVLESALSSSSSQSLDMLSQSRSTNDIPKKFATVFALLSKGLNESSKKQLSQLDNDFKQLLLSENSVRKNTLSILNNRQDVLHLGVTLDLLSDELQKSSASLVGKINLGGKRIKRKLKKLVKIENIKDNSNSMTQLVDVTKTFVSGNQDKLMSAANKLMVASAKISAVAQKMMTAKSESEIIDLEQNQGLQIFQSINKSLKDIERLDSSSQAYTKLISLMNNKKNELTALLFGSEQSVKNLRLVAIAEQIKREKALKNMLVAVHNLSKNLKLISQNAQKTQSKVVADTEESINSLTTYNTIVFIAIFIILVVAGFLVTRLITKPISEITNALAEISSGDGDLTKRLKVKGVEEVITLSNYFNDFVSKIQNLIISVDSASKEMAEEVLTSKQLAENSKQNIASQQASTEQLSTVMEELSHSFAEVASSASRASTMSEESNAEASQGKKVVGVSVGSAKELSQKIESGVNAMNNLSTTSQSVASVLDVIKGIADQTNLLALNAAIEAARAGEQGRGFAVVADEVRALASKTQESTGQISDILGNLKSDADEASEVMSQGKVLAGKSVKESLEVSHALDKIIQGISGIADLNYQIASSAGEQSTAVGEAAENVEQINNISGENLKASELIAKTNDSLDNLSHKLQDALSQFKI